jgi:heptosyltransferase III
VNIRGKNFLKKIDLVVGTVLILILSRLPHRKVVQPPGRPITILVLKLAAMGDTLLLVPALRSLRKSYPEARITLVGTSINEAIASEYPQYIDEFKRFDVDRSLKDPKYFVRFVKGLREIAPDMVLDFEQWSNITPIIARLSGAHMSAGFKTEGRLRHLAFNEAIDRHANLHECENFLRLVRTAGVEPSTTELELPVNPDAVEHVTRALLESGWVSGQKIVLIHPGCGAHGFPREWPLASYTELCSKLADKLNPFFVFTGVGVETPLRDSLKLACPGDSVAWTEPGLRNLISVLSMSDLVISGNNGVMHLAAALHRPQIALHGPTNSVKWGPINSKAVVVKSSCPECPCLDLGFEYHRTDGFCMEQIPVGDVLSLSVDILNTTAR